MRVWYGWQRDYSHYFFRGKSSYLFTKKIALLANKSGSYPRSTKFSARMGGHPADPLRERCFEFVRIDQAKQEAAKKVEEEKNKLLNNLRKKLPW